MRRSTVYAALRTQKFLTISVCVSTVCSVRSYKYLNYSLFGLDTGHNRSATHLLPCRWYVVQSQPRNPLITCVKSLLLWKPCNF